MSSSKHHIFTHYDLDGAVSLLTLIWMYGREKFTWQNVSNNNASLVIDNYIKENPDKSLILLDLSLREEFLPFLNRKNIKVFDHHKSSTKFINNFDKINLIHKEETSNSLLLYKTIKECKEKLSPQQKALIKLTDDYDSYQLKYPESYDLNIIFWHWYQNKFEKFISDFEKGFCGFSKKQIKAIEFIKQRAKEVSSELPLYEGNITYKGKTHQVLATHAEKFSPLIIDHLIKEHKPELFFFINLSSSRVNLRQVKDSDFDISEFAETICDGGGHHNAAGGSLTEPFLELLKKLNQIR